ncbi:SDR family NAD(P)-dependent oxidoreductase [Streptomyces sp. NPDC056405]|uniref:SDR family NAD(P)-dependent oxidoreductase n=1 Tax=Streptomyces sp. NPDC056405 TaxID=3345811 RepID=UPI0035DBC4C4
MSTRSARSPSSHTGRVAVVTGAAGGFGHAIAGELARRGADIIAVDLDPADRTVEAVQEIGRQAVQFQADLSDPEQVAALVSELLGFAGRVDVLVNNAGAFPFKGWGRIVNLASDSLGLAVPRHGPLHGRQGRGRRLHPRPRPYGFTVNAISPTGSRTPGGRHFIGDDMLRTVADGGLVRL